MDRNTGALTRERVEAAYGALGSGDRTAIEEYWDPRVTWQAAGRSRVSRTYTGLDEFIGFLTTMGELSGGSLAMEFVSVLVGDDTAVAVTHNTASRAGDPGRRMDIEEVHVLRWRDGRIVSGRGAMLGAGTAEFEAFVA
ncbi:nuclear transport factor 2 family protein [Streptomyces sp. NPDC006393]|uniref:nuclear transport factor 2 family protein n=1 Tax=Streptomyces sp. NPDC006393 TaxID=3156763 RepID=UPI0033D484B9